MPQNSPLNAGMNAVMITPENVREPAIWLNDTLVGRGLEPRTICYDRVTAINASNQEICFRKKNKYTYIFETLY